MVRVEPEIVANYVAQGKVQLAFSHVLDHRPSPLAHQGAECAGAQAPIKFWKMHNALFERQSNLWQNTEGTLAEIAQDIGLDTEAFQACLTSGQFAEKVQRMDQARRSLGIRLRPSFDLNGRVIPGAQPYETFARLFDEILSQ